MILQPDENPRRYLHLSGFTLVEAVVSSLIIGAMFVAAINTVGASRLSQYKTSIDTQGRMLGELLMAEILEQDYVDPNASSVLAPESGESTGTRAAFDDVDDYNGWSSSPPVDKYGSPLDGFSDWQRSVTVDWINPLNPGEVKASETSAKLITVTVKHGTMELTPLVAIKTAYSSGG